jgi:1,4-alpha-glucan branching enzyme
VLKKRFFKTKAECEVAFELPVAAQQVELVCETNDWQPIEMKRGRQGTFRARLRFPQQRRIQFRYLVDRATWINDEAADAYWPNAFGSENGVLDTTPRE